MKKEDFALYNKILICVVLLIFLWGCSTKEQNSGSSWEPSHVNHLESVTSLVSFYPVTAISFVNENDFSDTFGGDYLSDEQLERCINAVKNPSNRCLVLVSTGRQGRSPDAEYIFEYMNDKWVLIYVEVFNPMIMY